MTKYEIIQQVQKIYSEVSDLDDALTDMRGQLRKIQNLLDELPEEESEFEEEKKEEG